MNNRAREKNLQADLSGRASQEAIKEMAELLNLRLERYKNALVSTGCDLIRGRAQEVKDLLKILVGDY